MSRKEKRFVIGEHSSEENPERIHWDFMLESQDGPTLATYRLDKHPRELMDGCCKAEKIFDHPVKFLTYHGPVNKGKGRFQIAERGTYTIIGQEDNRIELNLKGQILQGRFTLEHIEGDKWNFYRDVR